MSLLGAAGGADPFAQAIYAIEHPLPAAPSGYKGRVILQFVLCGLLAASSILYVLLHIIYSRSLGKGIWLFKLQRTDSGRLIVVNSLMVFAGLSVICAAGQFGSRWEDWRTTILGECPYNDVMARFAPWLPVLLQAWFFSTTNLWATIAARRKFGTVSRLMSHAWVQNAVLLVIPAVIIGIALPLAIVVNTKTNKLLRESQALLPDLRTASADLAAGRGINFEIIGRLTQAQSRITALQSDVHRWLSVLIAVCCIVGAAIIIMNAYSLLLVLTLQRHVKANQERRTMQEKAISFTQAREVSVDLGDREITPVNTSNWPTSSFEPLRCEPTRAVEFTGPFRAPSNIEVPTATTKPTFVPSQNDIALHRLARDLLCTVPIILTMCIILISGLAIIVSNGFTFTHWSQLELSNDLFAYVYLVCITCAIWLVTFNLLRAWRSGKAMSTGGFSVTKEGSATTAQHFTVTLDVPAADLELDTKERESDKTSDC